MKFCLYSLTVGFSERVYVESIYPKYRNIDAISIYRIVSPADISKFLMYRYQIFDISMARYGLFVLKVPLNPNQLTNLLIYHFAEFSFHLFILASVGQSLSGPVIYPDPPGGL